MAYNSSLYNPYGLQTPQAYTPTQQPINGITFINVDDLDSYWMPAGSVSQPLFVDGNHFIVKTFDKNGGSAMEAYETKKIPLSSLLKLEDVNVTKADLEAFKAEIMEAINGRNHFANVQPAETTAEPAAEQPIASTPADPSTGIV